MNIAVIGAGYVGLVQGVGMAELGHSVFCVEVLPERLEQLQQGKVPFFEPGLDALLKKNMDEGRLTFAGALPKTAFDLVFVAVQTPQSESGAADLRYLKSACREVGKNVVGSSVVVLKSTVPPGVREEVHAWLGRDDLEVAANPEFLREGKAVTDFMNPSRIVFGVESERAELLLRAAYEGVQAPVFVMSVESAQLAKYAANTMLAMRLSLMNEIANIADVVGADIRDVAEVVGSDPRIGSAFLRTGAGFGGSCFPKDVLALEAAGVKRGYVSKLIRPIIDVNTKQAGLFVKKMSECLGALDGRRVAVWGLAFNAETDDVRESPAIRVIQLLLDAGAVVVAYDPRATDAARQVLGDRVQFLLDKMDTLKGADVLAVLTEWPEFIEAPWEFVAEALALPFVFDGKNVLPGKRLAAAGLRLEGIGLCQRESQPLRSSF